MTGPFEGFLKTSLNTILRLFKGGELATGTITTSTTGTDFVVLPDNPCNSVTFVNNTGQTLLVKVKTYAATIPLFDGSYFTFDGINTSAELSIQRADTSNTPVTITFTYNKL